MADVWATVQFAAICRRLAEEVEAAIASAVPRLYIASVELMPRCPAGRNRCARELFQAKSRLWHCRGDSSQTLKPLLPRLEVLARAHGVAM